MRAALALAMRAEGRARPNPAVGCVIVHEGRLFGRGWTADGGRPHAETMALAEAGAQARGSTAYVTLEPCAHEGRTPPCADALIEAGITRVVVGIIDPDPRVSGQGISRLERAGIDVLVGVMQDKISSLLRGYILTRSEGRPSVTVKIASTLDGRIALADGRSQWITSPATRQYVHLLRSRHDALLTGASTVRADTPSLTCRLPGYDGPQPLRVILAARSGISGADRRGFENIIATSSIARTLIIHPETSGVVSGSSEMPQGIETAVVTAESSGRVVLLAALRLLAERGITSVLVEAGGTLFASLLRAGLVDQLIWTRSAGLIGAEGLPSLGDFGLERLEEGGLFSRRKLCLSGPDTIEILTRNTHVE